MKKYIYLILALILIAFIFVNSLEDAVNSAGESMVIVGYVQSLLAWFGFIVPTDYLDHVVRKCAHVTEFALQAFFVAKTLSTFGLRRRTWLGYALLLGLLTAVIDENIQLYSVGRSGQVTDVLLDFGGTLLGVAAALLTRSRK